MDDRRVALSAGVILIVVGIAVAGVIHDTAIAGMLVLAGCVLAIYAFMWDRLKKFGPSGVELFEEMKEQAAQKIERKAVDTLPALDDTVAAETTRTAQANAQAMTVRAAKTPEELIDVLVKRVERLERPEDQMARIRSDDRVRQRMERYGPTLPRQ
jgi:hypothetical protein